MTATIITIFLLGLIVYKICKPSTKRFRNHPDSNMSDFQYWNENEPNK